MKPILNRDGKLIMLLQQQSWKCELFPRRRPAPYIKGQESSSKTLYIKSKRGRYGCWEWWLPREYLLCLLKAEQLATAQIGHGLAVRYYVALLAGAPHNQAVLPGAGKQSIARAPLAYSEDCSADVPNVPATSGRVRHLPEPEENRSGILSCVSIANCVVFFLLDRAFENLAHAVCDFFGGWKTTTQYF